MSPKRPDQKEVRVYLNAETYSLLRRLAGVRESSLNRVMNEAVEYWLAAPEQQATIDRHNLDEVDEDL